MKFAEYHPAVKFFIRFYVNKRGYLPEREFFFQFCCRVTPTDVARIMQHISAQHQTSVQAYIADYVEAVQSPTFTVFTSNGAFGNNDPCVAAFRNGVLALNRWFQHNSASSQ